MGDHRCAVTTSGVSTADKVSMADPLRRHGDGPPLFRRHRFVTPASVGDAPVMARTNTRSVDDPPPRSGILIVRVWSQRDASPQIRLTRVADRRELPAVTVTSVEEALAIAQRWLAELVEEHREGRRKRDR
jgi:hypothetical protein